MKLVTAAEMKIIEGRAEAFDVSTSELMLNAGNSVFEAIKAQLAFDPDDEINNRLAGGLAVVIAGSGNNGGDAMVVAALLKQTYSDAEVKIYFHKRSRPDSPNGFDKRLTYTEAEEQTGYPLADATDFDGFEADLYEASLIVDGLFGAGISRSVTGDAAKIIDSINMVVEARKFEPQPPLVVAIDVPSGLNTDTGTAMGTAIYASLTVTLGYPKIGLYNNNALNYTGRVLIGDIGLPAEVHSEVEQQGGINLITADYVRRHLPARPLTGHKGTFGKLMVVSGAPQYLGAPYLCTSAGMRAGAGLVTLAAPDLIIPVMASKMSENTFLPVPEHDTAEILRLLTENLDDYRVLLFGPGLGQTPDRLELLQKLIKLADKLPRMVIDADGLNLLAQTPDWWQTLPPNNILTPHPAELGRLRKETVAQLEQDRLKSALEAAQTFKQIVILKGAYTVVAAPDGRVYVNPGANPALATAGSGDVLAGICAGILTQLARDPNCDAFEAACVGTYIHALAGELLSRELGDTGVLAGDLLQAIPQAISAVKNGDSLEG